MGNLSQIRQKQIIAFSVVIVVLFCDQLIKFLVKTNMMLHRPIILMDDWAQLYFTENKGMAFGLDFMGTILLCSLRIVAVCLLVYYLLKVIRKGACTGFIVCMALVLAGAAGNIFDNVFYGLIYSESTEYSIASLVPFGEGYGKLLSGKVVDMFYFHLIDTHLPDWLPFKGGDRFIFFAPIFNFADSAITCGGLIIVLFYHRTFSRLFSASADCENSTAEQEKQ